MRAYVAFTVIPKRIEEELRGVVEYDEQKERCPLLRPAYSLVLHTSPLQIHAEPRYHWHLELRVRLPIAEGFEWGTGFFVNPIAPEEAAKRLRAVAEEGGSP